MNQKTLTLAIRALRQQQGNAYDNLYRAKLQLKADPTWRTGNDESIQDLVADYQKHYDELTAAIADLEGK